MRWRDVTPVGARGPYPSTPWGRVNSSAVETTSPSSPTTSVIEVTMRLPSRVRASCTTTLMADAICSRIARRGRSTPAKSTIVSNRRSASRGACIVDSERRGLFSGHVGARRHNLTDHDAVGPHPQAVATVRIVTWPALRYWPGGLKRIMLEDQRKFDRISTVTTRSLRSMWEERMLSMVVLPVPVPPLTKMFIR